MDTENFTLDWIEMSNGDVHRGIVDFSNNRFIHFYNFDDKQVTPDLILIAIVWRLKHRDTRFSVFCAMRFSGIVLPRINIINRKGIKRISSEGEYIGEAVRERRRVSD